MEITMFYYMKDEDSMALPTEVLVVPFGSNARALVLLAKASEWIRDTIVYTHLINSDEILKKEATYVDHTQVAKFMYFIKHISNSSIQMLVTKSLEFAVAHGCSMIDMPLFTANGFKAPAEDTGIMKTMLRACNEFTRKHKNDAGSLEISFILDESQSQVAAFCKAKGIQYSGRKSKGEFKR